VTGTSLATATARELRELVATGKASAVEVTQAHLDRIAETDGQVQAFLDLFPDGNAREVQPLNGRTVKFDDEE
jgi:aspartyl-tRNA(Asn)/glutamyl-tRNA(Gln) amidotransferase subunit A